MVRGQHSMMLNAPATPVLEHLHDSTRRHAWRTTAVVADGVGMHNALGLSAMGNGALHGGYGSRRYGSFTHIEQGRAGGQARYDRSRTPRSRPLATACVRLATPSLP